KIGQFTGNPLIRNIIGQPKSSFDLRKLMDGNKILIANLSKGRVGEQNANLLGGMLMTKIYLSAMSRADMSDAEMKDVPPFFLFVDEFQSFVNDSFKDILSEARKYKLNLTIAHQYVDQMPEEVRSAVFGNVGTTIAFRVGPFDAETLETIFMPKFTKEDLVNLGFAQIYLTLMIDGVGSPPFSAVTLAPFINTAPSLRDKIIEASRLQFSHGRVEVEEAINRWHDDQRVEMEADSRIPARSAPSRFGSGDRGVTRPPAPPPSRINIPESVKRAVEEAQTVRSVPSTPTPVQATVPVSSRPFPAPSASRPAPNRSNVSAPVSTPNNQGSKPSVPAPSPSPRPVASAPKPIDQREELKQMISQAAGNGADKKLSLSALAQPRHPKGTTANKDDLRAALSELVKPVVRQEAKKEAPIPSVSGTIASNNRPAVANTASALGTPESPAKATQGFSVAKEVPEDVLRKILE
ncbi:MAG: TraM recognition domain-containing protein, partial [Candidatus Vogelbacteria bacterium]|nr:TraM recognition domain-containing protein [Candidatus Vogelbacteria bacterium]